MKKLFILPCVLSVILLLSYHAISVSPVFAGEDEENATPEQTEQVEQTETTEHTSVTKQPDSGHEKESDEIVGSTDIPSNNEQSSDDLQPHTPSSETVGMADAAKKPLVIDGLVLTDAERRVFELTNIERKKRGLPALRLDRRLMESARRQANWMARTGIFRHGNSGYAENIAMGQRSGRDVVVAWLNSAGHFRNMMNRSHGAIGIGSYPGKNGALFWCQQFSR